MDMMWGMWGMMGWMIVPWLLLIAAAAVGVWWLVRRQAPATMGPRDEFVIRHTS